MTEEEKFLLALYKHQIKHEQQIVDIYHIGRSLGFKEKKIKTITKCLHLSSLLKKEDDSKVYLTTNGLSLVDQLLNG